MVVGCDEVGRGALGGPVAVGVVAVDSGTGRVPRGLRDSKLLSAHERERLVPEIQSWARGFGVGYASPGEIDQVGIVAALGLAGRRALADLEKLLGQACRRDEEPRLVLLDGNHDWLSPLPGGGVPIEIELRVRADLDCASVSAASVVAKVARDRLMVELSGVHPLYGWEKNKGYGVAEHRRAIAEHGACDLHRRSWDLPLTSCPGPSGDRGRALR